MFLWLYDVTDRQFNFTKNYFLHKEKWTSISKRLRSWASFFSSLVNCLTNLFSQKNAIGLFTLVLTNINRILQADSDQAIYHMQGTILTDHETSIIRNTDRSDIQLGSTIDQLNNDTASLKIKNSIVNRIDHSKNVKCLK